MSWAELLAAAEAIRVGAVERSPLLTGKPLAGIGWATVDQERVQQELDGLLAGDPAAPLLGTWASMDRDPALGATGRQRISSSAGGLAGSAATPSLVVLEPDTEGRLAAYLARFGEGVGVIYLGAGPARAGEVLRGGPVWGPHVIVLDGTA